MILWLDKIETRANVSQRPEKHIKLNYKEHRKQSAISCGLFNTDRKQISHLNAISSKRSHDYAGKYVKMPAYKQIFPWTSRFTLWSNALQKVRALCVYVLKQIIIIIGKV